MSSIINFAIQSKIFENSPRRSLARYAGFTTIQTVASIDSAVTVMLFIYNVELIV